MTKREAYAPWIADPDSPNEDLMTPEEIAAASTSVANAFPELVDHSRDQPITTTVGGNSLAEWAAGLARDDKSRIDNAIRSGLIGGLDNTAIARKVVGSAGMHGVDGVTEVTRQRVANLGRAAVKRRKKRGD